MNERSTGTQITKYGTFPSKKTDMIVMGKDTFPKIQSMVMNLRYLGSFKEKHNNQPLSLVIPEKISGIIQSERKNRMKVRIAAEHLS